MTNGTKPMPNDTGDADILEDGDDKDLKIEEIDSEDATPEQVEQLKKVAQTARIQRAKWKERAIDPSTGKPFKDLLAEAKAKQVETPAEKPNDPPVSDPNDDLKKTVEKLQLSEEKRKAGDRHKLSSDETDLLFQMSGNDPSRVDEIFKTDFFQAGLTGLRAKAATDSATPGPSNRSPQVEGKSFNQMNEDERRKNFDQVRDQLVKK